MEIYKIIADSKPKMCITCPIRQIVSGQCGKREIDKNDGWQSEYTAPDDRCKFEVCHDMG